MNESRQLSTAELFSATLAVLNAMSGLLDGAHAFATDARKDAEGGGAGTGIPVWYDVTSSTWRTYTTGAAAAT